MDDRLILWDNTFQSVDDALILASERVDCGGFEEATLPKQEAALIQAYRAICRIPFVVANVRSNEPFDILSLTSVEIAALPTAFTNALRMAQLVYADDLLGGDQSSLESYVSARQRAGIVEERIGESSIKISPFTQSASTAVPLRALRELSGYSHLSVRVARA